MFHSSKEIYKNFSIIYYWKKIPENSYLKVSVFQSHIHMECPSLWSLNRPRWLIPVSQMFLLSPSTYSLPSLWFLTAIQTSWLSESPSSPILISRGKIDLFLSPVFFIPHCGKTGKWVGEHRSSPLTYKSKLQRCFLKYLFLLESFQVLYVCTEEPSLYVSLLTDFSSEGLLRFSLLMPSGLSEIKIIGFRGRSDWTCFSALPLISYMALCKWLTTLWFSFLIYE